ncbi:hypothetical protein ATCC90586_010428 [Pythium insidiosum]|nr:hypothetical protein ATCC90586_010428 [Pythium insidiosum]
MKKKLMALPPASKQVTAGRSTAQSDKRCALQSPRDNAATQTIQRLRAKAIDVLGRRKRQEPRAASIPSPMSTQQRIDMAKYTGRDRIRCPRKDLRVVERFASPCAPPTNTRAAREVRAEQQEPAAAALRSKGSAPFDKALGRAELLPLEPGGVFLVGLDSTSSAVAASY